MPVSPNRLKVKATDATVNLHLTILGSLPPNLIAGHNKPSGGVQRMAKQSKPEVSNDKATKVARLNITNAGHDKTLAIVPSVHQSLVTMGIDVSGVIAAHKSAVASGLVTQAGKMTRKGQAATSYTFKGEARELADTSLTDKQAIACQFAVWHDAVRSIFTKKIDGLTVGEFDFYPPVSLVDALALVFPAKAKEKANKKADKPLDAPAETPAVA